MPAPDGAFWSSLSPDQSAATLQLVAPGGLVGDEVVWDAALGRPGVAGGSISLRPSSPAGISNNDPLNWCSATTALPSGVESGTPRAVNAPCL